MLFCGGLQRAVIATADARVVCCMLHDFGLDIIFGLTSEPPRPFEAMK